jgi:hypothetical protein
MQGLICDMYESKLILTIASADRPGAKAKGRFIQQR